MKKRWIYIILSLVVVTGFFFIVLEKDEPINPDTYNESGQNKEEPRDEEVPDENIQDENNSEAEEAPTPELPSEDIQFEDIQIGEKLPDFTLKSLDGKDVNLRELEGKIVLINFWATWCPWCDKEMADLQRLDNENEDLIVLGVNVDEPKPQVEKYVKEGGYEFEVVLDQGGIVAGKYLVTGLPASYFVNEKGIYVGRIPSFMTFEQMNEALDITRDY